MLNAFFTRLWWARILVPAVFVAASLYMHLRGRVRLKLLRQLGNHATLMAPYNVLMYVFSAVPARPIVQRRDFPELDVLRDNWEVIREEALALCGAGRIRASERHDDVGFNSFFRHGWKRFYVKWYGAPLGSARKMCPRTVALVDSVSTVNAAMFALLPPGGRLSRHRDPFAGSLRYHLGLVTPNSDACRIYIDGQPSAWRDGDDIVFDETYVHYAENATDQYRIILFCDVERPLKTPVIRALNRFMERTVMRAAATQNTVAEPVGVLNRIYALTGRGGELLRRAKRANRTLFRTAKQLLIAGILYWLVPG